MTQRVFSDAEFLRTVNVVPFDPEAEAEEARQRESQALYMFLIAEERKESIQITRMLCGSIFASLCIWAAMWAWLAQ